MLVLLSLLEAAVDGAYPKRFRYFNVAEVKIAGEKVIIGRSGFTNELGWEFYLLPDVDAQAVGNRILEAGKPFGMMPTSAEAFRARGIEAGLHNAGSDFDERTGIHLRRDTLHARHNQGRLLNSGPLGLRSEGPKGTHVKYLRDGMVGVPPYAQQVASLTTSPNVPTYLGKPVPS